MTHLFGRELLPKLETDRVLNMLDDALSVFEEGLPNEIDKALVARLQFRRKTLLLTADQAVPLHG